VAEGASNLAIKSGWWSQLFSSEVAARLPRLKLLMWVECMTFGARRGAPGLGPIPSRYGFASG
jgi:hypothetical protein